MADSACAESAGPSEPQPKSNATTATTARFILRKSTWLSSSMLSMIQPSSCIVLSGRVRSRYAARFVRRLEVEPQCHARRRRSSRRR